MGSTDTGSAESGSPASDLGNHQWLRLPSGALYEHFGGLRYRLDGKGTHRVVMYGGAESCIRIFRPHDSETAEAILFLPKADDARLQEIQAGLLERLSMIEKSHPVSHPGLDTVKLSDTCTIFRNASYGFMGATPFVDGSLYELIKQYSASLGERYAQEGEKFGRALGAGVGGVGSVLVNTLILTGMSELTLENIVAAVASTVAATILGSYVCKNAWANRAKNGAHEILRERLVKGHTDETHLYHLARFIQTDYRQTDVLKTRDQALDGAFKSLARTPAGEGLMICWQDLSYDKIVERCEMLLGVRPARYLPSRESAGIIVPGVAQAGVEFPVPDISTASLVEPQVKVSVAAPASRCSHCHDEFMVGDSCITGLLNGAHSQAHADCSGEMIESAGNWQPISGAYAYESLVDHTTSQPERKKDERRVKE